MQTFSKKLYKFGSYVLTVYKSKPKKKVLLLSTKYTSVKIEENSKHVPETIAFYNQTKYGVDVVDQMARKYNVKPGSRRWPLQVFYNILDLSAINAQILHKDTTGIKISIKYFIFQLDEELVSGNEDTFNSHSNLQSDTRKTSKQDFAQRTNQIIFVSFVIHTFEGNVHQKFHINVKTVMNKY